MATGSGRDDVQRYIQRLERELAAERGAREQAEAIVAQRDTYISFLESFLVQLGQRLGVRGKSKEALDAMMRKVNELTR